MEGVRDDALVDWGWGMTVRSLQTPIGLVWVEGDAKVVRRIGFAGDPPPPAGDDDAPAVDRAVDQLEAYFAGERTSFDLPLAPEGTPFQRRVWDALQTIPYGATVSYRDIAERIGAPKAVRAVGAANGRNPLPIVVPCHRVIGSDGSLTGFAGGLDTKRRLLALESPTLFPQAPRAADATARR
jgi:methylated-DNA-[protein]-cysteine S-methyltransferase